jgi:hypothetical protein
MDGSMPPLKLEIAFHVRHKITKGCLEFKHKSHKDSVPFFGFMM